MYIYLLFLHTPFVIKFIWRISGFFIYSKQLWIPHILYMISFGTFSDFDGIFLAYSRNSFNNFDAIYKHA